MEIIPPIIHPASELGLLKSQQISKTPQVSE